MFEIVIHYSYVGNLSLDTLVFPVSPWKLRAPDQLVRYLRPSVWLVLGGRTCIFENTCVLEHGIYSTDVFQMGFLSTRRVRSSIKSYIPPDVQVRSRPRTALTVHASQMKGK
jgi:hypothetical protein